CGDRLREAGSLREDEPGDDPRPVGVTPLVDDRRQVEAGKATDQRKRGKDQERGLDGRAPGQAAELDELRRLSTDLSREAVAEVVCLDRGGLQRGAKRRIERRDL